MLMFIGIVLYGAFCLVKGRDLGLVRVALLLFAQFALMSLLLLGQGVIEMDGRAMEDSVYGWYGQLSVLMVYSNFWYFLYAVLASLALTVRLFLLRRTAATSSDHHPSTVHAAQGYYESIGTSQCLLQVRRATL